MMRAVRASLLFLVACGFRTPSTTALPGDLPADGMPPDSPAAVQTRRVTATGDAYTRQQFPDENHGADAELRTGSGSTLDRANRAVLTFDLATLDGCDVTAARLAMYYTSEDFIGISPTLEVHRVTTAWDQASVTWNTPWTTPGGDYDATAVSQVIAHAATFGWLGWDVLPLVTAWRSGTANDGLIVVEPDDNLGTGGRKVFASSESTLADYRPYLEVTCR